MAQTIDNDLCRGILENAPDAILFADRNGTIRFWNAGAEAVFGFSEDEALGQSLDLIIPERLRVRHWSGYHQVMATGETHYGRELLSVPALHKNGGQISSEFSIILLKDKLGQVLGLGAIMRDISKRRMEEKALKDRLAILEQTKH
ncbi:PAS domain-containing protein [Geoalkalibacter sp.]|uniref:PAS domain-containing protein n=1 Tax=Geoalkalibacter sp. TaxID=3041440 RepID=UPI00272E2A25|nr:PAS domain S-box protein [Geoalkalibacter sp.]